jgi:hypothetical protein
MATGVSIIIINVIDRMGCILAGLQGRRCVPDHLTHWPWLDGGA